MSNDCVCNPAIATSLPSTATATTASAGPVQYEVPERNAGCELGNNLPYYFYLHLSTDVF